jgi:hypothetical protein
MERMIEGYLALARGHGGDLILMQSPMKGLRARLRLPV